MAGIIKYVFEITKLLWLRPKIKQFILKINSIYLHQINLNLSITENIVTSLIIVHPTYVLTINMQFFLIFIREF